MAFYDLSIPNYEDPTDQHFSQHDGGDVEGSSSYVKRYMMPMVIKNNPSNKVYLKYVYKGYKVIIISNQFIFHYLNLFSMYSIHSQNENKHYTTRFFLVDTVSGFSSSPSASSAFNSLSKNKEDAKSGEPNLPGLRSKERVHQKEKILPQVIRYLKKMEIK